jgi:predicted ArsR family transcriptional regulator
MVDPNTLNAATHPTRLAMLAACSTSPHTAAQLRDALNITDGVARHHLHVLVTARLLQRDDDGVYTAPGDWQPIVAALEDLQPD